MQEILIDLVHHTKDLFDTIKIEGTAGETNVRAVNKEKTTFFQATLKVAQPDLAGEFGLSDLPLLEGLLNFPSYKTDQSKFSVKRVVKDGEETAVAFTFRDEHNRGAVYKTTDKRIVPEQADIKSIPWTISFTPSKSKISEFTQLARLFSGVDKSFKVNTEDDDLIFLIGDDSSSVHNASMIFESGVTGALNEYISFEVDEFLNLLRKGGNNSTTLRFTPKGVLGVNIETETAEYRYFLRAKR